MSQVQLSIIVVSYNERDELRHVLQLLGQEFPSDETEIIVVDNQSRDGSLEMAHREFPRVKAIASGVNMMYGKGNNFGFEHSHGAWLLVLNPDVDWQPGALHTFVTAAKNLPKLGAAGPQLRYPDGRIQLSSHRRFPSWFAVFADYCLPLQQLFLRFGWHPYLQSEQQHQQTHRTATLTGVCLLIPRAVYQQLGGFDPTFSMYLEETEWQKRMSQAGFSRWFVADSSIIHFGSAQKTFAQASQHYLWGLEYYTRQHWSKPFRRGRLLLALWTGTIISVILLLLLWPVSIFAPRGGQRLRHYLRQYLRLAANLLTAPTKPPLQS